MTSASECKNDCEDLEYEGSSKRLEATYYEADSDCSSPNVDSEGEAEDDLSGRLIVKSPKELSYDPSKFSIDS